MEISKQIKKYRKREEYSQEQLAEKIYVSRQTISNWENNRSYPDVHNLMMLSVLFKVSIDELIKGDIEYIREQVHQKRWKLWSNIMLISALIAVFLFVPAILQDNRTLLISSILLYLIAFLAAVPLEIMKRKHKIYTYRHLINFYDGKNIRQKNSISDIAITYLALPVLLIIVMFISYFMFYS